VSESVLLDDCVIGTGAKVAGSVLAPGVTVEAGAELADAVIGRDERVPVR
jgi:ADP-glucose pyrophosphorylase